MHQKTWIENFAVMPIGFETSTEMIVDGSVDKHVTINKFVETLCEW